MISLFGTSPPASMPCSGPTEHWSARRVLVVLSPDYLKSAPQQSEWSAAFAESKVLPIRVRACHPTGLLAQLVAVDLVGLSEASAREVLRQQMARALRERGKPTEQPTFPGRNRMSFPGTAPSDLVGRTLSDGCMVLGRINKQGGIGEVYLARTAAGEWVAVKTLQARFRGDSNILARFQQEARLSMQLRRRGVVHVREYREEPDVGPLIVMDYVDGDTLREWMGRGEASEEALRGIFQSMAKTMAAMHQDGVIHRDLKPENVILRDGEAGTEPVILDFGLARPLLPESGPRLTNVEDKQALLGTPDYMAPECWDHTVGEVGAQADVYALGVMLFEGLWGHRPFGEQDLTRLTYAHLNREPKVPWGRKAGRPLARLTLRMLAKRPESRPTMEQVGLELDRAATFRPQALWLILTGAVVLAGLGGLTKGLNHVTDAPDLRAALDLATGPPPTDLSVVSDLSVVEDLLQSRFDLSKPSPASINVDFVADQPRRFTIHCTAPAFDSDCVERATVTLQPRAACSFKACGADAQRFRPANRQFSYIKQHSKQVRGRYLFMVTLD